VVRVVVVVVVVVSKARAKGGKLVVMVGKAVVVKEVIRSTLLLLLLLLLLPPPSRPLPLLASSLSASMPLISPLSLLLSRGVVPSLLSILPLLLLKPSLMPQQRLLLM